MSRFTRFAANVRFNLYGQVLQAALPLFFTPFILRHLGREAYSLYALITVLTSQLNLLSFGAGEATVKYLAEFDAGEKMDKVDRLVGNSLVFYGMIGLLGAGLLLVLTPLLEQKLLHVPQGLSIAARCIFLCSAGVFLLRSLSRPLHSLPQALQRFDVWNGAEMGTHVFLYAGIYFLLTGGFWLRSLAVWNVAVAALNLGIYFCLSRRLLPHLHLRPAYDSEMMRTIIGFGGWQFLGHVGWSILCQVDKLVLYRYVPLADVTYYLIAFNLAQKLFSFVGPILPILLPFSSALHGRQDYDTARKLYLSGTKLTVILVWPAAILAFFFAPSFLELWLGGHFSEHAGWVLRFLVLGTFFNLLPVFGGLIAQGFGQYRASTLLWIASLSLGIPWWFVWIPRYGALGAAWVFLGVQCLNSGAQLAWCNSQVLNVHWRSFVKIFLGPIALSIPVVAFSFLFRNSLKEWAALISFGIAMWSVYVALCYRFALNLEERSRFSGLLARR